MQLYKYPYIQTYFAWNFVQHFLQSTTNNFHTSQFTFSSCVPRAYVCVCVGSMSVLLCKCWWVLFLLKGKNCRVCGFFYNFHCFCGHYNNYKHTYPQPPLAASLTAVCHLFAGKHPNKLVHSIHKYTYVCGSICVCIIACGGCGKLGSTLRL